MIGCQNDSLSVQLAAKKLQPFLIRAEIANGYKAVTYIDVVYNQQGVSTLVERPSYVIVLEDGLSIDTLRYQDGSAGCTSPIQLASDINFQSYLYVGSSSITLSPFSDYQIGVQKENGEIVMSQIVQYEPTDFTIALISSGATSLGLNQTLDETVVNYSSSKAGLIRSYSASYVRDSISSYIFNCEVENNYRVDVSDTQNVVSLTQDLFFSPVRGGQDTCVVIRSTVDASGTIIQSDTLQEACFVAPQGALFTAKWMTPEYAEFEEALTISSEDIGGFFPDNLLLPSNIENGYGYFTIVEVDTTWITW